MRPNGLSLQQRLMPWLAGKACFRDIQVVARLVRAPRTSAHRDSRTGSAAWYRIVRVTPPNIHSLSWEWP
jgi:hypothetical protein